VKLRVGFVVALLAIIVMCLPGKGVRAFGYDWYKQSSITANGYVNAVMFVDASTGYAGADSGLYVTHDAGMSWSSVTQFANHKVVRI